MQTYFLHPYSMIQDDPGELSVVQGVFGENCGTNLSKIPVGSIVIPRYRAIPFGRELQEAIESQGSTLINSYRQHRAVADTFAWSGILRGLTPKIFTIGDLPSLPEGEYFVKGETNSVKNQWFTSCYAPTKTDLIKIIGNFQRDLYVGNQEIVIKPFQHFRQIAEGVTGQPIFHERRVFILDGKIISDAFYWSSFSEFEPIDWNRKAYNFALDSVIPKTQDISRFYVIDLAEYPDGHWTVVELNDGPMSGLSNNDPEILWSNFKKIIEE